MPATKKLTVLQAINKIMEQARTVEKDGHNAYNNYKYSTEIAIIQAVRNYMIELGVVITPFDIKTVGIRKNETVLDAIVTFRVYGPEGDYIEVPILASGEDKGDKSPYKLMTGANKYVIQKVFQLPMGGDDPEATDSKGTDTSTKQSSAPTPQYTQPTQGYGYQQPQQHYVTPQHNITPQPQQHYQGQDLTQQYPNTYPAQQAAQQAPAQPQQTGPQAPPMPNMNPSVPVEQNGQIFVDHVLGVVSQMSNAEDITKYMQSAKEFAAKVTSNPQTAQLGKHLDALYADKIVKEAGERFRTLTNQNRS